jgi:uncharacterized coiled-coil protein SlyX
MRNDFAGLAVLSRAWDRLPPVVTNRSGAPARLELWVKSRVKRLLRWVTWEQVNFNAATHQTFRDLIETLVTYEQQLLSLRSELASETTKQQAKLDELRAQLTQQQHSMDQQRELVGLRLQQLEIEFKRQLDTHGVELNARLTQLESTGLSKLAEGIAIQIREGDERILDEQRVCFKQLSFEANETLLAQERAQRKLESRLEKLEEINPKPGVDSSN